MTIQTINPATGKTLKTYDDLTDSQLEHILTQASQGYSEWRKRSYVERAEYLRQVADILRDEKDDHARLMAEEMGKPLDQGKAEAEKCAWVCDYYAENAEDFLADENRPSDASTSYVHYEPIGPVLAIMPWNYPMWQVYRFAAPALMAGNVGLLKHAENVTGTALRIENIFERAGLPDGVFKTLLIDHDQTANVVEDDRVKAVTLTGSNRAGKIVASRAGDEIKKTVLELGGSDPYVVLEDADIDEAVESCVTSRLLNSGQSCIAAKRFVVHETVYDEFLDKFYARMESKRMGDPLEEDVDIGPQAREDLRDELHEQVNDSVSEGANLLLGGELPDRTGAFYPPTILTDVPKNSRAFCEELFGPVATVLKVESESEAIEVANDSKFGLGAAVFTSNLERGERIAAEELEAGCCFVNHYVKSDPRLPFGGIKKSGYGRELSEEGIREFVNAKTVCVYD